MKRVCAVVGVGPGNGASLAKRFAKEGYAVALMARSTATSTELAAEIAKAGGEAKPFACDASDPASVAKAFGEVKESLGEVDVVLYNAGSGTWGSVETITPADFEASWRVNALGLLATSQAVVPDMKKKGKGAIIVTGATASRRGGVKTAAFAPAKAAQKSLCESMARALWPAGVHVALIILDGVVDLPRTRKQMADKPESFFLKPDDLADVAFRLTEQAPSAWSFEVEARPFGETW